MVFLKKLLTIYIFISKPFVCRAFRHFYLLCPNPFAHQLLGVLGGAFYLFFQAFVLLVFLFFFWWWFCPICLFFCFGSGVFCSIFGLFF
jgi:hypothetical protein